MKGDPVLRFFDAAIRGCERAKAGVVWAEQRVFIVALVIAIIWTALDMYYRP